MICPTCNGIGEIFLQKLYIEARQGEFIEPGNPNFWVACPTCEGEGDIFLESPTSHSEEAE